MNMEKLKVELFYWYLVAAQLIVGIGSIEEWELRMEGLVNWTILFDWFPLNSTIAYWVGKCL